MPMSKTLRNALIAAALGAASAPLVTPLVLSVVAEPGQPNAISIDNFTFNPAKLTVKAGTTVTWTNKDDIPHGIAWTSNTMARSKAMDTNDSVTFTFTTPGTYQYFCYIHPTMVGSIVVKAATGSNATQ